MTKFIRVAIYTLASKQGREMVVKVISIILCLLIVPGILLSGFASTYFAFYGGIGSSDDEYSQAVNEVKTELSIENNFEAAILRAIFYKLNGTLEIEKSIVIDTLKTYFVKSEEREHTVSQEDIDLLLQQISEIETARAYENSQVSINESLVAELTNKLNELKKDLEKAQNTYIRESEPKHIFLELNEIKEVLKSYPFSFDSSYINDIENYVLYIGNLGNVDFGNITFENETANEKQTKIVTVATSAANYGIYATEGKCQKWVADIYLKVIGKRGHAASAIEAGRSWSVSNDWSKIQVGATVYGTASNQYGHVGIYIGNGQVIHNLDGYVKIQSLESWVKSYKGKCWGWENGQNLTGNHEFDCIGNLI